MSLRESPKGGSPRVREDPLRIPPSLSLPGTSGPPRGSRSVFVDFVVFYVPCVVYVEFFDGSHIRPPEELLH